MPHNQNHSRFVNRLIFLRSWYVWDLHLVLHLRLKFSLNLLRLLRGEGEFGRLGLVSSRVEEEVCSPNLPMLTSSAPFHAKLKSTTKLQLHAASLLPLCPARFGLFLCKFPKNQSLRCLHSTLTDSAPNYVSLFQFSFILLIFNIQNFI